MNKNNLFVKIQLNKKDFCLMVGILSFIANIFVLNLRNLSYINAIIYFDIFIIFLSLIITLKSLNKLYTGKNCYDYHNRTLIQKLLLANLCFLLIISLTIILIASISINQMIDMKDTIFKLNLKKAHWKKLKEVFVINKVLIYFVCLILSICLFTGYAITINVYNLIKILNNNIRKLVKRIIILTKNTLLKLILLVYKLETYILIEIKDYLIQILKLFKNIFIVKVFYKINRIYSFYKWSVIP
ncbi:hypothetical protein [Spiroplasma turonicum]|nr:hypothetical protein [Spiroplasma turonicum]